MAWRCTYNIHMDMLFISNIVHRSRIIVHLPRYILPTHKLLNFHEREFIMMINDISLMRFYLLFQQDYWMYLYNFLNVEEVIIIVLFVSLVRKIIR